MQGIASLTPRLKETSKRVLMQATLNSTHASSQQNGKSHKARKAPEFDRSKKLHAKITSFAESGRGSAAASTVGRQLGQGRREIWQGHTVDVSVSKPALELGWPGVVAPAVEAFRSAKVYKLSKEFSRQCAAYGRPAPALTFERWLLNSLALNDNKSSSSSSAVARTSERDPLLPPVEAAKDSAAEAALLDDLARGSMPSAEALVVASKLAVDADAAAQEVRAKASAMGGGNGGARVMVVRHAHTLDVSLQNTSKTHSTSTSKRPDKAAQQLKGGDSSSISGGGSNPGKLLKLNTEHYGKLRALWTLHRALLQPSKNTTKETIGSNTPSSDDRKEADGEEAEEEQAFHASLFCLLSRYNAVQGHGFQAACSEHVMRVFAQRLGVTHECFASPLNCYFPTFCSAFPDTDAAYGSQGSFWQWRPPVDASSGKCLGGSFQANPPFVADLMLRMALRIEEFFENNAKGCTSGARMVHSANQKRKQKGHSASNGSDTERGAALSFVVVVPGWPLDPGIARLRAHPLLRLSLAVPKADHGFCDGAQHQRRDRYRESPYDTFVLVLQNDAAAARWPCKGSQAAAAAASTTPTTTKKSVAAALLEAFALAKPTEAAIARRAKEGRGFADADGGGGVFKGKKSKNKKKDKANVASVAATWAAEGSHNKGKKGSERAVANASSSGSVSRKKKRKANARDVEISAPSGNANAAAAKKSRVVKHGDGTVSFL